MEWMIGLVAVVVILYLISINGHRQRLMLAETNPSKLTNWQIQEVLKSVRSWQRTYSNATESDLLKYAGVYARYRAIEAILECELERRSRAESTPVRPASVNQEMLDQGIHWPTDEMLRSRGLNSREIEAYRGMARAMDDAYSKLDEIRRRQGKPPMERRPGFIQFAPEYFSAVVDYYVESLFKYDVQIPTEAQLKAVPPDDPSRPALVAALNAKRQEYERAVRAIARFHPELGE